MGIATVALALPLDGFTPVRRRPSTVNTRQSSVDAEKEWTAARCNRLLRSLTSRISVLKKDFSLFHPAAVAKHGKSTRSSDEDWTCSRKRIKRTYSGRGGRINRACNSVATGSRPGPSAKDTRRLIPGEIVVSTPVLHRAKGFFLEARLSDSPLAQQDTERQDRRKRTRSKTGDIAVHFHLSETMQEMRKNISAGRYTIYEGIFNGLEALLKMTTPEQPDMKRQGVRPLLAMCLRAIPIYISREEKLLSAQLEETGGKSAINKRDISTEIYDDLEAFGSSGHGWKHLRDVVRSHGIQVLSDAIRDELLNVEFCGILVSLCIQMSAAKEAELLLSALLSVSRFPEPKSVFACFDDDVATRPLSIFWKFVATGRCFSFQYRQLSSMIFNGILPLSWSATKEFGALWARAIQEFSRASVNSEAIMFMNTVLPMLADADTCHGGLPLQEAVRQTFSSLITTLTAIVILRGDTIMRTTQCKVSPGCDEITTLLQSCLATRRFSNVFNAQGTLMVLANFLIMSREDENAPSNAHLMDFLLQHLRHKNSDIHSTAPSNHIVTFLCSIARCCGRGASNSGFEYLLHLHKLLEKLSENQESDVVRTVMEIIVDSAFGFALEAPDRKHLDYAASVEVRFHVIKSDIKRDALSDSFLLEDTKPGFRWEEGISEWVTATPVTSTISGPTAYSSMDEAESGPSYKPPSHRGLPKAPFTLDLEDKSTVSIDSDVTDQSSNQFFSRLSRLSFPEAGDSPYVEEDIEISSAQSTCDLGLHDSCDSEVEGVSSPRSEGLYPDDSSVSDARSSTPASINEPKSRRQFVDRAPRLSRRVLRPSLQWQLFEESDDELSSFLDSSQPNKAALREIKNLAGTKALTSSHANPAPNQLKSMMACGEFLSDGSEDELGI
jgi:hypothetical protein